MTRHAAADSAVQAGVDAIPYLAMCPWDIERWQSSRAYRRMSLAG